MAKAPQTLTLSRNRDRAPRDLHVRRALLTVLALFLLVGLLNVFGQRPATTSAAVSAAKLSVYGPSAVRSGLYFEARLHVQARRDLKDAQLVLSSGWLEGMTINTIEPSPLSEGSRNGQLVLDLGHIPAGRRYLLFVQSQVNPTNVGRRAQRVELWDGSTLLVTVHRRITIFP